jgi:ABC-2 type transport system permease protein
MIRQDRIWAIVQKELMEFRRNKYILYSLILMPFLLATVLPALYLAPVVMFATDTSREPLELNLNLQYYENDADFSDQYVENTSFENCNFVNVVAVGCEFINCSVDSSLLRNSSFQLTTLQGSTVIHSNLDNTTRIDCILTDSRLIGETSDTEKTLALLINIMLIFFTLIPTIIPTVVASYTIVGEKLNRSLEPLLATPTTDLELLLGKSASIFIPSVLVTWLAFVPFVFIVDFFTYPVFQYNPLPNNVFLIGVYLLAPLLCILSILCNVIVSSKVSDVRSAQQIGSLVVMPFIALLVIILLGMAELNVWTMLFFALVVVLTDLLVLFLALRIFRREEILVKWK